MKVEILDVKTPRINLNLDKVLQLSMDEARALFRQLAGLPGMLPSDEDRNNEAFQHHKAVGSVHGRDEIQYDFITGWNAAIGKIIKGE